MICSRNPGPQEFELRKYCYNVCTSWIHTRNKECQNCEYFIICQFKQTFSYTQKLSQSIENIEGSDQFIDM